MNICDRVVSKNINLKNRVIMPPMATAKADENGHVTDEIINYYIEKTECKFFSAVIVEHSYVEKRGIANNNQMSISKDSDIEGLKKLADVIKNNDAMAILQIAHAGGVSKRSLIDEEPVSASAVFNPLGNTKYIPRELSKSEIEDIRDKFIAAAIRVKKAGFDGVEIHSAHGYLLNQFLSPIINKRTDEYGGDIHNRIKLHCEIIKGIREKLGDNYPIFLRMGAGDFTDGGLSVEDAVMAAKEFEQAGVDVLDISGGMCFYSIKDTRAGYFDVISKPIFDNVNIPVILTGGVQKGTDIVNILNRNVCDMVGVGRKVFHNSKWMKTELKELLINQI